MVKKEERVVIECPYCGREYTPDEIFLPNYLIGKSKEVLKYVDGTIDMVEYSIMPDKKEKYICDNCNKPFIVYANLSFQSLPDNSIPDDYFKLSLFPEDRLVLPED